MNTTSVNILAIGVKAKSKNEMYRALTIGDGLYLPPKKKRRWSLSQTYVLNAKR